MRLDTNGIPQIDYLICNHSDVKHKEIIENVMADFARNRKWQENNGEPVPVFGYSFKDSSPVRNVESMSPIFKMSSKFGSSKVASYIPSESHIYKQSQGQIHPRVFEIFENHENAISKNFKIKKSILVRVQKTFKRL